jgi:hypothetical protein
MADDPTKNGDQEGPGKDDGKKGKKLTEKTLLAQGCEAFGIDPRYVFASRLDTETGEMVILTNGGSRIRWAPGMEVEPLSAIAITGINPIKRKPITGPGAGKKK